MQLIRSNPMYLQYNILNFSCPQPDSLAWLSGSLQLQMNFGCYVIGDKVNKSKAWNVPRGHRGDTGQTVLSAADKQFKPIGILPCGWMSGSNSSLGSSLHKPLAQWYGSFITGFTAFRVFNYFPTPCPCFKICLIVCVCISNRDFSFKMGLKPEM